MVEDFHIDMSGRIYKRKTIGVACVGTISKNHNGCALKGNIIKFIQKNRFFSGQFCRMLQKEGFKQEKVGAW